MLVALLLYGYATGTFSSRALERASYDLIAVRYISANTHPDHDTINSFRKRFLKQIEAIFVPVLGYAQALGMLKVGTVSLEGTKLHANASRHSGMSYGHAKQLEAKLKAEAAELMRRAEAANAKDLPEGLSLPEELSRRATQWPACREGASQLHRCGLAHHASARGVASSKPTTRNGEGVPRKPMNENRRRIARRLWCRPPVVSAGRKRGESYFFAAFFLVAFFFGAAFFFVAFFLVAFFFGAAFFFVAFFLVVFFAAFFFVFFAAFFLVGLLCAFFFVVFFAAFFFVVFFAAFFLGAAFFFVAFFLVAFFFVAFLGAGAAAAGVIMDIMSAISFLLSELL